MIDLICAFCGKECKNKISLAQHSIRCKSNPNRKDFLKDGFNVNVKQNRHQKNHNKGKIYITDGLQDRAISPTEEIPSGWRRGHRTSFRAPQEHDYVHREHNNREILKWLNYVKSLNYTYPILNTTPVKEGYCVLSKHQTKINNTVRITFVHNYIANILLDGQLKTQNCVHHINKKRDDNRFENLVVFVDAISHKRFHNSRYAYLIYDESNHLFSCIKKVPDME